MPTPKRLPSGRWRVQVQHRGRRRSATAPTREEAEELGHALALELRGVVNDELTATQKGVDNP